MDQLTSPLPLSIVIHHDTGPSQRRHSCVISFVRRLPTHQPNHISHPTIFLSSSLTAPHINIPPQLTIFLNAWDTMSSGSPSANDSTRGLVPSIPIEAAVPAHRSAQSTPYIAKLNSPPGAIDMTRPRVPRNW